MSSATETLEKELTEQVTQKLTAPESSKSAHGNASNSKDIYTAIFKEGAIQREYRFYAPAPDLSIEDVEKRRRDREARIWRLCKRYEKYLKSIENRKVVFVGVPQPFVLDLESKMAEFESKFTSDAA